MNTASMYPQLFGPVRNYLSSSKGREASAVSLVVLLFRSGRPAAVVWLIIAVVVLSFYAVVGRCTRAHVREEICKAISPTITYRDAATAPVLYSAGVAMAARYHVSPCIVFWSAESTMCSESDSCGLSFVAPTTLDAPIFHRWENVSSSVPAVAVELPHATSSCGIGNSTNRSKSVKFLSSYIFGLGTIRHASNIA